MNLINNISIDNFRGFDTLKIKDFNQINILVGKNNSGKSTVLEAIFLLIGMSNPNLPDNINRLRGLNIKSADEFKYLFHNLLISKSPIFHCEFIDKTIRDLSLNPVFTKSTNDNNKQVSDAVTLDASASTPDVNGLELSFSIKRYHEAKKNHKSSILFENQSITLNSDKKYKEDLHAVLISGNRNESNALARYSEIVKRKKGDIVLKALQKIDQKIESIHPLPDGLFFGYRNIEELIPSNIAGDGVRKYLNIVTTIAERKDSIVLIDEIENGLHYSAHRALWESIINIANEFSAQLFITSHNIESLKCLKDLLEEKEFEKEQQNLNIYSLAHTMKAGIKAYKYSFKGFCDAIETNTEIR